MHNMTQKRLSSNTPIIFADGSVFFQGLAKEYARHKRGLFILAPSGAGKTRFVNNQTKKHWIDGDYLWPAANADTTGDEWGYDFETVQEMNNRSDVITQQAKKMGFWIIGSSNNFLKPDAIVLPPWRTHVKYITTREHGNYDGGATSHDLQGVLNHRRWIRKWKKHGVPCFTSIDEAASYLARTADQSSS